MKTDLRDTTFIIPVRVDSMIRLENLLATVDMLDESFNTNIVVTEAAAYNNGVIKRLLGERVKYIFHEDKDPVFHRTKYLNWMACEVKTLVTAIWDADIVMDPAQIVESVESIRSGECDARLPYNGDCFDTTEIYRSHYLRHRDIGFLTSCKDAMKKMYAIEGVTGAVGGAVFIRTRNYIESGLDNEKFYGWGREDGERFYRWLGLGYVPGRSEGCIFHLWHPRDDNGRFRDDLQSEKARHDSEIVIEYTRDEILARFSSYE